jgi:hypothetical protein
VTHLFHGFAKFQKNNNLCESIVKQAVSLFKIVNCKRSWLSVKHR